MSNVVFLDLGAAYRELHKEIDEAVARVLSSGWYIGGEEVSNFESAFANYVGVNRSVGVANGLDALILSLKALGVGPGDEVIVPSNTYIATWLAVTEVGATVVPVEPDLDSFNISPLAVEDAITSRTRAIIVVHLYGRSAQINSINDIAKRNDLRVIEDAAQCHGAEHEGQRIGGHSDIVAWSFYPGKNLGALGDGGAITTNNRELAEKITVLRNYGSDKKYTNLVRGMNSRLDPIQAAILNVKLKYLTEWNLRRAKIAATYSAEITHPSIKTPSMGPDVHAWHLYVVRSHRRDDLLAHLQDKSIECLIHYPIPPHMQRAYRDHGFNEGQFPVSEILHREVLSLPIGPHLSEADVERVVTAVNDFDD